MPKILFFDIEINKKTRKVEGIQNTVSNLFAGEELLLSEKNDGLKTQNKKYALKFSKKFRESFDNWIRAGYTFCNATANFIVLWYNKEEEREVRVILPKLELKKTKLK